MGWEISVGRAYEPRIDGLRAVAVLTVIFFHLGFSWMPGGYVGVDVFFVISGYLITRLILTELKAGEFSFLRFYHRRIRRLGPAFLVTVALSVIASFLLFAPKDLIASSDETWHVLLQISNIFHWMNSGYFDPASTSKPLLHTWSLAVEEQFYLVWPALLFLIFRKRISPIVLTITMALVVVGGLIATQYVVNTDRLAAFYLTPFRMFEFAIGALIIAIPVVIRKNRIISEIAVIAGLALILTASILFTEKTQFPGIAALLPCLGAALCILPMSDGIAGRLLNNSLAVGIGLISYSLYLVHWPIIVFWKYSDFSGPMTDTKRWALVATSIMVALTIYFIIERPLRRPAKRSNPYSFGFNSLVVLLCIMAAGVMIDYSSAAIDGKGYPERLADGHFLPPGYGACRDVAGCSIGDPAGDLVYVGGDSFALHLTVGLDQWGKENHVHFLMFTGSSCPIFDFPLPSYFYQRKECERTRAVFLQTIKDTNRPVILAERWRGYDGIAGFHKKLGDFVASVHSPLIVIGQPPEPFRDLTTCVTLPKIIRPGQCEFYANDPNVKEQEDHLRTAMSRGHSLTYVHPERALCADGWCRAQLDGKNLYYDQHHFTDFGSRWVVNKVIGPEVIKYVGKQAATAVD